MFSNTVLALPTTAVLPTHTAVFGKLSVMELMPFRICHVPVIHAFFGLMFLSPKNAKLVVVHTNLRGDSLAMVYYTELPRENSLSPAGRVKTKDLPFQVYTAMFVRAHTR